MGFGRMLTALSLHQGQYDNRQATFQQYAVVPAEIVAKVCHAGLLAFLRFA